MVDSYDLWILIELVAVYLYVCRYFPFHRRTLGILLPAPLVT